MIKTGGRLNVIGPQEQGRRGNDDFGSRHINDRWVSNVRADIGYWVFGNLLDACGKEKKLHY